MWLMVNTKCQELKSTLPYHWISSPADLTRLVSQLQAAPLVAVDTESDSLYSYFEKVCLLQISTETRHYLVDPLAVDISEMATIFADPGIEKIFHAAEYDVMSLRRDYGFSFKNIFDTMIAAKILGWPKHGLGHILYAQFGVKTNKRFQQYNWGKRPLDRQALTYACQDTSYLHQLRAVQKRELTQKGRLEEARAAFERVSRAISVARHFSPDDFWRLKGVKSLSSVQQGILQTLFIFRDEQARLADIPAFKIMTDSTLLQLAVHPPKTLSTIKKTRGMSRALLRRNGQKLLSLLNQPHQPPHVPGKRRGDAPRMTVSTQNRYEHLRQWRNSTARKRGVVPDVILSNEVLKAIAKANPKTDGQLKQISALGQWQFKTYANQILNELNGRRPA